MQRIQATDRQIFNRAKNLARALRLAEIKVGIYPNRLTDSEGRAIIPSHVLVGDRTSFLQKIAAAEYAVEYAEQLRITGKDGI